MLEGFREELAEVVRSSAELLSDEEALAIVQICKDATNRKIASVTEEYLANCFNSEGRQEDE